MVGHNRPTMYAVDHYNSGAAGDEQEPDQTTHYAKLSVAVRRAFEEAVEWYDRENIKTNPVKNTDDEMGFYEPGQPGEIVVRPVEEEDDSGLLSFGESGPERPRASISVYVRKPLNDYSGLEEVFEFYTVEPSYDQADRGGVPAVRYCITRQSRTNRPGVDSENFTSCLLSVTEVPADVLYRAKRMIDHVELPSGHEEVDDDADD